MNTHVLSSVFAMIKWSFDIMCMHVKLATWFVFFVDVIDVDVYDIDSEFIPTPNGTNIGF